MSSFGSKLALFALAALASAVAHPAASGWIAVGPSGGGVVDIEAHPLDSRKLFVVAGAPDAGAFRTLDGGATWEAMLDGVDLLTHSFARDLAVDRTDPDRLFLVIGNANGRIYRSVDGGSTWAAAHAETGQARAVAVDPADGTRVLFGTAVNSFSAGELFLSQDGGGTFTDVTPSGLGPVWTVLWDPHDGNFVYSGGNSGLWRSADGGLTWTNLQTTTVGHLSADPFVPGRIYVSTYSTGLWRSDDRGVTLTDITGDLPWSGPFSNVSPDAAVPDRLWVGGRDGAFVTDDGGVHWSPRNTGLDHDLRAGVDYVNALLADPAGGGRVWAGVDGGLYETGDGGASWNKTGVPSRQVNVLEVDPAGLSDVTVGTETGLFVPTTTGGFEPSEACVADSGFQIRSMDLSPDGWLFVGHATSFFDSALFRTRDGCVAGGQTESVLFISQADGINAVSVEPGSGLVVLAAPGSPFQAGAAIFRSTLGGTSGTFSPVPGTDGFGDVVRFAWDPDLPGRVLALSSGGAVYESLNLGAAWTEIKTGLGVHHHRIEFQPDDPDTIYLTYVDGILRSTNDGGAWSPYALAGNEVTGFQIAVNDPDVMFASVRGVGVMESENRGATWLPLGGGPPHTILTDLLFRAEVNRLFAGTRGGGVYLFDGAGRIGPDLDLDVVTDLGDNCPATFNPGQENADGDPVGDPCDCAAADPTLYAIPGEVGNLTVEHTPDNASLTWDDPRPAAGPATTEEISSGDLGALRSTGAFGDAVCLASGLASPTFDDMRADPLPGAGLWYLVRAVNACGDGTWGDASPGVAPDPRNDLDLSSPCP